MAILRWCFGRYQKSFFPRFSLNNHFWSALTVLHLLLRLWLPCVSAEDENHGLVQQTFAIQPSDRTAIVGKTVVLACRVINKVGTLQWTRDGFGLGSDRELRGFPRYTMIGSDDEGDYTLQIGSVSLEDDAVFQCQVGASSGIKGIRSRNAALTVHVPPEPPKIVQGDFLRTTAGMSVELTCESHKGKPPAELTWLDGEGDVVSSNVEYTTQLLSDQKRANAFLKWVLTPSREHDGKTFTCRSENPALMQPQLASITLEVKYPPDITLKISSDTIVEFDTVRFTCEAIANPNNVIYKWYRNDEIIPGDHSTTYTIPRIRREFNRNTITCEVSNAVGTTKSTHTLNVQFGPEVKTKIENVAADLGQKISLSCEVDGNPSPQVTWHFRDSPKVLSRNRELIIQEMTQDDAGKYTCKASVAGFTDVYTDVLVFVKGIPKIRSSPIQYGAVGETVKVECLITSVPPPTKVLWSRNSQHVDIDNSEGYEIVEEPVADGVRNLLVIRNSDEDDFGQYNCSVWNEFGQDSMQINVQKQKSLPMLIILAGVTGGIVLIVSVTIIITLCLRHKSVNKGGEEYDSEKKTKQSDSASSGDSDLKVEIRTASSLSNTEQERNWDANSDTRPQDVQDPYKYSSDYYETNFPPKPETQNNNGYIPYVDYSRDYNPSPVHLNTSRDSGLHSSPPQSFTDLGHSLDPRYRAGYANPYLQTTQSHLPPPHTSYLTRGRSHTPSPTPPASSLPQNRYITAQQPQSHLVPGTLATHV